MVASPTIPTQPPHDPANPLSARFPNRAERRAINDAALLEKRAGGVKLTAQDKRRLTVIDGQRAEARRLVDHGTWCATMETRIAAAGGYDMRRWNSPNVREWEFEVMHEVDDPEGPHGPHLLRDKLVRYYDAHRTDYATLDEAEQAWRRGILLPALAKLRDAGGRFTLWAETIRLRYLVSPRLTQQQVARRLGKTERSIRTYETQGKQWLRGYLNDQERDAARDAAGGKQAHD